MTAPVAKSEDVFTISLPTKALATIADNDYLVASLPVPGRCELLSMHVITVVAATTGSKGTTLTALKKVKGTAEVSTGVSCVLTTTTCNAEGEVLSSSTVGAIRNARIFNSSDLISVKASDTTAFGEGEAAVVLYFKRIV